MNVAYAGSGARVRAVLSAYGLYVSVGLFCLAALAILWGGLLVQLDAEGEHLIEAKRRDNDNLARVFEEHVSRTLRAAEITLNELAAEHQRQGDHFDVVAFARSRRHHVDPYNILSFVDAQGMLTLASPPTATVLSMRHTDSFRHHVANRSPDLFISAPRKGSSTGKWTVYVSRRVDKADGSFAGLWTVGMDPAYFSRVYATLDMGRDGSVVVVGRDAIVRACSTTGGQAIGQDLTGTALFTRDLPGADHGSRVTVDNPQGAARIYSYRAMQDYPLVVVVGTSRADTLAAFEQNRPRHLLLAGVATMALLACGALVMRQVWRLEVANRARRERDQHAEAVLQQERDFATRLIRTAPAIIMLLDQRGAVQLVNPFFEQFSGYRSDEIRGLDWFDTCVPQRDRADRRQLLEDLLRGQHSASSIGPMVLRDGREREVEWNSQTTRDVQGQITGLLCIGQDVTARHAHAQEIQRLAAIVHHSPVSIGVCDLQGRMLFVNESGKQLVGVGDAASWRGALVSHFMHGPDRLRLPEILQAVMEQGRWVGQLHYRHVQTDEQIPVQADVFRIDDALTGRPINFAAVARDLRAERAADLALRVKDAAIASSINAVAIIELDGTLSYVNQAFARLWRLQHAADAVGRPLVEFWERPDEAQVVIEAVLAEGSWQGELSARRADGSHADLQWSGHMVRDEAGAPRCTMGSFVDVTQRNAAERALRLSEDRLREAQHIAQVGSWELDLTDNSLLWSDEVFDIFELDRQTFALTFEGFLARLLPQDSVVLQHAYARSLQTREPYELTHRLVMDDGRVKWVQERCTSDFDSAGQPLRSRGTVQDVTERKLAEIALRELNLELEARVEHRTQLLRAAKEDAENANRAKSLFLTSMSHELRTPLNAVLGYAQLIELRQDLPADLVENAGEIRRAGNFLLALVNDILDLARVESGHLDIKLERFALQDAITECQTQNLEAAIAAGVNLECDGNCAGIQVQADWRRLVQVLNNLISNAIKYNLPGGAVQIACSMPAPDRVVIAVTDTGPGLTQEQQAQLFQAFNRVGAEMGSIKGTGIGLSITRRFVEAMHGRITVDSVPGQGSTFRVEFPAARP
jgi:PAS domain S-box-containing protein